MLLERLAFFLEEPRVEYVANYLEHLLGKSQRVWSAGDFELRPPRKKRRDWDEEEEEDAASNEDPGRQNLYDLGVEFVGHVHRSEGVPLTKAELARSNFQVYLQRRAWGELQERQSMFDAVMHPKKKAPPPTKPLQGPCPDAVTLDRYLADLLGMLNLQFHEVAATFELVPAWLRFLEMKQLISSEQREKTLRALGPTHDSLRKLFATYHSDPALYKGLEAWGGGETGGPSP